MNADARTLYLDLLKRSLVNLIYLEHEKVDNPELSIEEREKIRRKGLDWPEFGHTMIGIDRLNNIQECMESVLAENIPGDFMECGVWRGGATIFMRGVLAAHGVTDRQVIMADSFQGLPSPNPKKFPADAGDMHHTQEALKVSLDEVLDNFEKYGLVDTQIEVLCGWFHYTLPRLGSRQLAVLRIDCDMYESTMTVLDNLYSLVAPGGYVIIDDYFLPAARRAVDDFRAKTKVDVVAERIMPIDWTGVYWKKQN